MSKAPSKKSAPKKKAAAAISSIAPHLVVPSCAEAIAFYIKAFGAKETLRIPMPDGKIIHAAIQLDGMVVMLTDEMPKWGSLSPQALKGTPVTIHLTVTDVDQLFTRAVEAGAVVKMPVADQFWGDRYGIVQDPFGHNWSIATHQRDMTEQELRAAALEAMSHAPKPDCKEA
jgi:uncharacterized glyoxalase superfamily protein PhnB